MHTSSATHPPLRIFTVAAAVSLVALTAVGVLSGLEALFSVLVLAVIEVTFSFDNAIVNAKVLERMPRVWQTIFLTVGIAIAVFGMRLLLPIVLVAGTADLGFGTVVDLALHHPDRYAQELADAHAVIAAFGGTFLMMIFLRFLFEERKLYWVRRLEKPLAQSPTTWLGPICLTLVALSAAVLSFASNAEMHRVTLAGLAGLTIYCTVTWLSERFQKGGAQQVQHLTKRARSAHALRTGLFSFIYLELLDASFSFDGVVAAFAITKNVLLIAVGLGIGALFVRSLTVYVLRRGVMQHYIYLEHGAYYAIGTLAVVLLLSIGYEIPSFVTGIAGVSIIGLSIVSSNHAKVRPA
ncbi:MAG TPA: DUF475 domain-containing protein [Candidatus Saccharimonadales bacterium]|nr:DUF475 domain-containing protein [Candidatus Saccharimonadales bacterium]